MIIIKFQTILWSILKEFLFTIIILSLVLQFYQHTQKLLPWYNMNLEFIELPKGMF